MAMILHHDYQHKLFVDNKYNHYGQTIFDFGRWIKNNNSMFSN
jgi:hypothetical protein